MPLQLISAKIYPFSVHFGTDATNECALLYPTKKKGSIQNGSQLDGALLYLVCLFTFSPVPMPFSTRFFIPF